MGLNANRRRDLFNAAKRVTNKTMSTGKPVRNTTAKLKTSIEQHLSLWEEFYSDMLSSSSPLQHSICACADNIQIIPIESPNITEICVCIKSLKNNKSPGSPQSYCQSN